MSTEVGGLGRLSRLCSGQQTDDEAVGRSVVRGKCSTNQRRGDPWGISIPLLPSKRQRRNGERGAESRGSGRQLAEYAPSGARVAAAQDSRLIYLPQLPCIRPCILPATASFWRYLRFAMAFDSHGNPIP